MNELIILFILLGIIAFFMTIVEYFIELKQARAKNITGKRNIGKPEPVMLFCTNAFASR